MQIVLQNFKGPIDAGQPDKMAGIEKNANDNGSFKDILKASGDAQNAQPETQSRPEKPASSDKGGLDARPNDKEEPNKDTKDTAENAYIPLGLPVIQIPQAPQKAGETGSASRPIESGTGPKAGAMVNTGMADASQQILQPDTPGTKEGDTASGLAGPAKKTPESGPLDQSKLQYIPTKESNGTLASDHLPDYSPGIFSSGGSAGDEQTKQNTGRAAGGAVGLGLDNKSLNALPQGANNTEGEKSSVNKTLEINMNNNTPDSALKDFKIDQTGGNNQGPTEPGSARTQTTQQQVGQQDIKGAVKNTTTNTDKTGSAPGETSNQKTGAFNTLRQEDASAANTTSSQQKFISAAKDDKKQQAAQTHKKEGPAGQAEILTVNKKEDKINDTKILTENQQNATLNKKGGSGATEEPRSLPDNPKDSKNAGQGQGYDTRFVSSNLTNTSDRVYSDKIAKNTVPIEKKDIAQGLKDQVIITLNAGEKNAVIHLNPPELGKISVHLTLTDNHELKATFIADHPDVRTIIQGHMDGLKDHLDQKGFNVTRLAVEGGAQTDASFLDQRQNGHAGDWANDFMKQPFTNAGRQASQDGTEGMMAEMTLHQMDGRVNLII